MKTSTGICLTCLTFILVFNGCSGGPEQSVDEPESPAGRIENGLLPAVIIKGQAPATSTLTAEMERNGIPGVCVAVINEGAVEWIKGYGLTSEGGHPVDADTLFRATQMSQLVTAMGILDLVEDGKLDLDTDLNELLTSWHIPDNEFTGDRKVTLRRILNHSAGLSLPSLKYYSPDEPIPNLFDVLDGRAPATNEPVLVVAEPGEGWRYSVGGYAILQLLVEEVTAEAFQNVMRERVLEPSGMSGSFFAQQLPADSENAAVGYDATAKAQNTIHPELAALGLWTTARDLANLVIQIQHSVEGETRTVLSRETAELMLTPGAGNWGLGPEVRGEGDGICFSLEGHGSCYLCYLVGFPRLGKGAVVLTNSSNGEIITREVLRTIAVEYGWPEFRPREVEIVELDDHALDELTGTFKREGRDYLISLERRDGDIYLIRAGREPKRLLALSPDRLIETEYGIEYVFERDERGAVSGMVWINDGRTLLTLVKAN